MNFPLVPFLSSSLIEHYQIDREKQQASPFLNKQILLPIQWFAWSFAFHMMLHTWSLPPAGNMNFIMVHQWQVHHRAPAFSINFLPKAQPRSKEDCTVVSNAAVFSPEPRAYHPPCDLQWHAGKKQAEETHLQESLLFHALFTGVLARSGQRRHSCQDTAFECSNVNIE